MKNENIPVNKNMIIDPDSEIIYASSVGVGADDDEIRLILFNKRLTSDGGNIEVINESDKCTFSTTTSLWEILIS